MNPTLIMTDTRAIATQSARHGSPFHTLRDWASSRSGRVAFTGVAFLGVYVVWLFGSGDSEHRLLIADLWNLPLVAAAGVAAWLTSRVSELEPRLRRAWRYASLAFFCYTIGNVWWLISQNVYGNVPIVSWADALYLAYYPLLFASLLSFPAMSRTRSEAIKLSLDAGTVLLSGVAATWFYLLAPALGDPATTPLETIMTIAYPVGDIVLLFGSAFALLHRPLPNGRLALAMLATGGLVVFFTDLLYGHIVLQDGDYLSGSPVDLGWQVAALLWFLGAQYQRFSIGRQTGASTAPQLPGVSLLPYFAVAAGFVMLVDAAFPVWSLSVGLGVGTVFFLTLIVVVRQILAVRETARLVTERSAREARFSSMVQHSSDVISILNPEGILQFVSPAVGRVFRWSPESLVGRKITSLIHPDDIAAARAFLRGVAETPGRSASFVCRLVDGDGIWRHVETMCTSLLDDPTVAGLVLNTRDVSDRTRLEAELTRRAWNDPLTGLANRVRFNSLVDEALRRPQRRSAYIAVIYLDLDNFKTINDSLGHLQGDQLLIEFAARLLNATRGCDTVSRLGGDEFAVLLEGMAREDDALPVAERITSAMQKPFRLGNAEVVVGASIGIAHAKTGTTAEMLLRDADVAMYVAKRDGKGRYTVFLPEMQHAVRNSQELESDLRAAIDREEFAVVYQPIVDLRDGRIVSAEALLRWDHPVRGRLSPQAFLHTAIESGLIVPIGRIVLQTACAQLATWRRQHPELANLTLAVNVAGRQFQAESFPQQVAAVLEATGLPADRLVLEITESEIMKDTHLTLTRLHTLKALGVSIAIDDFGTGYSSLAYLQRFPVDVLKIDKSFVDQMAFAGHGQSLARMIIGLGEALGMRTIAEGIQDAEQATTLRDMRCEFAQGYYFSQPVAPDEFVKRALAGRLSSTTAISRRGPWPAALATANGRHAALQGAA